MVVEEFKQRYLNQPYGDVWLKLSPAAYQLHPYRWPTIGKEISHIENINMEEVKAFFDTYYAPSNAILVIAGNINLSEAQRLCAKWFAPIEDRSVKKRIIPLEPKQIQHRHINFETPCPCGVCSSVCLCCTDLHCIGIFSSTMARAVHSCMVSLT